VVREADRYAQKALAAGFGYERGCGWAKESQSVLLEVCMYLYSAKCEECAAGDA
jgi:hypothetical protein